MIVPILLCSVLFAAVFVWKLCVVAGFADEQMEAAFQKEVRGREPPPVATQENVDEQ